jgi:hypothetical protein
MAGMAASNIVGLAIILTAASTLHPGGITEIETSAQAAEALRPLAGPLASTLFALGIVGTGLLAVSVLAGSAAYAIGEALRWPTGLTRKAHESKSLQRNNHARDRDRGGAQLHADKSDKGACLDGGDQRHRRRSGHGDHDVFRTRRDVVGQFVVTGVLKSLGWLTTVVMAVAVVTMGVAAFA